MRHADSPSTEAAVHVEAPPERVWPLVTDMALLAELSEELQEVEWLDGAGGPALGGTFRGRNHHPQVGEWETVSTVVEFDEGAVFAWAVTDRENPSATWRFTLTPAGGGTEVRQSARMGPGPSFLTTVIARTPDKEERIVSGRLREWQAAIERNLAAVKERAEAYGHQDRHHV